MEGQLDQTRVDREAAKRFFEDLKNYLNERIEPKAPPELREKIRGVVAGARASGNEMESHKAYPEGAFLNAIVAPLLYKFLEEECGLRDGKACEAFLSESWRKLPKLASGSPARSQKHPFTKKIFGATATEALNHWHEGAVAQSCPDMALRFPCPHKAVIEGKYFREGGHEVAASALVAGIYQSVFYLGLPRIPADKKRPAWDYDFACFLACDATDDGTLLRAWDEIHKKVREALWDGANTFVMILHPQGLKPVQT